jgi:hypothetical protein
MFVLFVMKMRLGQDFGCLHCQQRLFRRRNWMPKGDNYCTKSSWIYSAIAQSDTQDNDGLSFSNPEQASAKYQT